MLSKEKLIRKAILDGKKIYEIPEVCVFRTKKPSKTEPGQALSVRAHVALAQSGIGSLGITDDMFDFDENMTVEAAIEKTGATLLEPGATSLYDLINQRVALLRRQYVDSLKKSEKVAQQEPVPLADGKDGPDAIAA